MLKKIKKTILFISALTSFFSSPNAFAGMSLIRDAEIERFLHNLSDPIFDIAGLNSKNIKIYIINDDSINAFVSGGQNVFVNTGLIRKYNTPDALIGVIAHETGHIAAGHLARSSEEMKKAEGAMLLSYLLGIGAALGGSPEAAQGLILGGSQTAERLYMKFSRGQEEAADQRAIEYLNKISYPIDGLTKLLEFFEQEMIGYKDQIDEYLLSHPVSRKRIDLIKNSTLKNHFSDKKINAKLQPQMNYVLAKLEGYIENPDVTLEKYKNDHDDFSNYKKSIAFFKKGNIRDSIYFLDSIINNQSSYTYISKAPKEEYELGFLYELRGQILFESGDIENSIIAYNKALKILKKEDSALAKISFAAAILSLKNNDEDLIKLAIKNLNEAKELEDENPFLFKQLANAYAKIKDDGRSLLALAEFNLTIDNKEKVRKYAKEAKEKLDKSAKSELLRADDLLELAKEKDEEKKKDK